MHSKFGSNPVIKENTEVKSYIVDFSKWLIKGACSRTSCSYLAVASDFFEWYDTENVENLIVGRGE
jgi:hypothetical protein